MAQQSYLDNNPQEVPGKRLGLSREAQKMLLTLLSRKLKNVTTTVQRTVGRYYLDQVQDGTIMVLELL